ncbi:MAG: Sigma-54 dependent transcriptional regulator [Nitrospira sp.]|jgi:DNA-binding NtrC family response regulator|nr:Sigma-54 dependent transcriptional regulator [Nitrospira sp.]
MRESITIFIISSADDGKAMVEEAHIMRSLEYALPEAECELHRLSDVSQSVSFAPHVVLLHQQRPDPSCERIVSLNRRWPRVPVIGMIDEQNGGVDELMKEIPAGLSDFVLCPFDDRELAVRIRCVLKRENGQPPREPPGTRPVRIDSLVGESPLFQAQVEKIPLFAGVDATLLLQGETGTGKELFARAIHYHSARKDKAFIPINCAALPDQLFENELFGHVKGAYTSAVSEQSGLVLEAEGGTLFLDEIDALNPSAQAKLLRFVQYREYRPLGCSRSRVANVRILAASNHDLRQAVAERQFREDLFHRLNVLSLVVPPLRDRPEDIPLLAIRFLQRYRGAGDQELRRLSSKAVEKLLAHAWPGNVRELESTLQRAVVMSASLVIQAQDIEFAAEPLQSLRLGGSLRAAKTSATRDVERAYLVKTLVTFQGNVTHAAKAAGKERRSFQRLLRKYGIDPQAFRSESVMPPQDEGASLQQRLDDSR